MRLTRLASSCASPLAVAIEDGEIDLALNQARGLHAANAAAKLADVAVDAELGIEAGAVGALLLYQALALAGRARDSLRALAAQLAARVSASGCGKT